MGANVPQRSTLSKLSFREPLESGLESIDRHLTTSQYEEHEEESVGYDVSEQLVAS